MRGARQVKKKVENADNSCMANPRLKARPGYSYRSDRHRPEGESHRGEIAAVVVERTDGTCTVLWAGIWRTFNSKPEEWEYTRAKQCRRSTRSSERS